MLLLEDMYYASGADTAAAAHIMQQAQCISDALGMPYCTKDSVIERCANSEHAVPLDRCAMLSLPQCMYAHDSSVCNSVMYFKVC